MNNVKTREEMLILRQNELTARNNYNAAFTEYIDALNVSIKPKSIACGDERFLIIKKVLEDFQDNPKISLPEEVDESEMGADAEEYQHLINILVFGDKLKSKTSTKKVPIGKKLANNFLTIHDHVTLKADKNDSYVDIAKTTAVYHDPNGKKKDNKLAKKRTEKAAKKTAT